VTLPWWDKQYHIMATMHTVVGQQRAHPTLPAPSARAREAAENLRVVDLYLQ
jgi:hypothetical protein